MSFWLNCPFKWITVQNKNSSLKQLGRSGRYIEFVRCNYWYFLQTIKAISFTVWYEHIWKIAEDTEWAAAGKVHNPVCPKHQTLRSLKSLVNTTRPFRRSDRPVLQTDKLLALFNAFEMWCFPQCITYFSQVYSPSVHVRMSWKYFHCAQECMSLLHAILR